MDWDKIRVFHAVAEAGSFTHAGETLNLSQSAVSRQISALEQSLRLPLFHRHARGLILTEQGELLYRTAREVFAQLTMTEAILTESKDRPKGPLTVTATVALGTIWLTPRISEFVDLYPEISLTMLLDDRELDLSMREADIAIRLRRPKQPDLVQRHLMTVHLHTYASPGYLKVWGTPQKAEDLERHRLIVYGEGPLSAVTNANWLLNIGTGNKGPRRPALKVNSVLGLMRAVESDLGIAALPDYIVQDTGKLVKVLPEIDAPKVEAYFVYPEELRNSKRIGVFRDFLLHKVAEWRF
ncbi:MAG: LysR family transcriptional regulator [Alphaproteobacteria bacterium]